jgi:hypothetical protein
MTEINDINQYMVSEFEEGEGWRDTVLYFQPEWKNKKVVDLACRTGWLGSVALKQGAEFVRFADARSVHFEVPSQTNHSFEFIDLNKREMLDNILKDIDIILYTGHFYHAANHEEILDAFENSKCSELFFESKLFHLNNNYHERSADIRWVYDNTASTEDAWHETEQRVLVGQPNFKWIYQHLSKRFDIKNIAVFNKSVLSNFYQRTSYYKKVNFHCVKKSV